MGSTVMQKHALIISFLLLFFGNVLRAQTFNFDIYTVEDGLAQNQILDVYQDSKGYMWIGTNGGGVSIYNGQKFKTISQSEGLSSNVVFTILETKNGDYFFATKEGLTRYDGKKYTQYTTQNGLAHNIVFDLLEVQNTLYIATAMGLCEFKEDTIIPTGIDSNLTKTGVFSIYEDLQNRIWFGTMQKGTYCYDGATVKNYNKSDGLAHNFVYSIVQDRNLDIWVGTAAGIGQLDKQKEKFVERRTEFGDTQTTIQSSVLGLDGAIWFGTKSGLIKYDDGKFTKYNEDKGIPSNNVFAVSIDKEGNIWGGTDGKGIFKMNMNGEFFKNYSVKDGLSNDIVTAIFEDSKGRFWFGSEEGITLKDGDDFTVFQNILPNGNPLGIGNRTYSIVEDKKGNIWFATLLSSSAVLKYKDNQFIHYTKKDGFTDNMVSCILQQDSLMYFGTNRGVTVFDGNEFKPFLTDEIQGKIWSICKSSNNQLWFAGEKGVIMYDGSSIEYFNETHGFVKGRVRTIVEDDDQMLWFATEQGLFRYDHHEFKAITKEQGLTANNLYSLLIDKNGYLWIGTPKGIQKLDIKEYNANGNITIKKYAKLEGFIGLECNNNASFEDSKGRLWFGTVKGATVLDPSLERENTLEPQTHITNIRLNFENYNFEPYCDSIAKGSGLPINLIMPYKKNHLSFDFIGMSYIASKKVRYQYMLEGLDDNWLPVTEKNEAVYPHIPAGKYTFKVKAMNNDGLWNSEPKEFSFTILPPWYQTWWFYSLCVLIIVSGFYAYTVYRTAALKKQKEILEAQVKERTAEVVAEKEKVEEKNKEVIRQNEVIEEKNKEITDSINYAKGIQEAILPNPNKVKKYLPQSFILFRPKDIVSGDFYWMEEKDGIAFFSAADCTGHGVPGAFVSMVGANGLNRSVNGFALRKCSDILDKLRDLVEETFKKRKDGMDLGLCGLDIAKKELQYAGANNPLWVLRKKGLGKLVVDGEEIEPNLEGDFCDLYEVKADKQPVGAFEAAKPFTNHLIKVVEGDSIYVFSDGYPDQFGGPKGKKFMSKSLKKLLVSIYDKSMDDQHDVLNSRIEEWMEEGNIEQIDDICVFGVRV